MIQILKNIFLPFAGIFSASYESSFEAVSSEFLKHHAAELQGKTGSRRQDKAMLRSDFARVKKDMGKSWKQKR
ncbi:MAG: hypothetical protein ACT6QS_05710 [Flavobacteriales bacterium]